MILFILLLADGVTLTGIQKTPIVSIASDPLLDGTPDAKDSGNATNTSTAAREKSVAGI